MSWRIDFSNAGMYSQIQEPAQILLLVAMADKKCIEHNTDGSETLKKRLIPKSKYGHVSKSQHNVQVWDIFIYLQVEDVCVVVSPN